MRKKDEVKWTQFTEVFGRIDADLVVSYFKAHGIETQLIQEAYEHFIQPVSQSRVQILVPNYQLNEARKLYEKSGWNFDITETDDDEDEAEDQE